jgi:hypothetical protein
METINDVEREISRLYNDNVNVDEVLEVMRDQNVRSELVKSIYDQLSKEDDKLMKNKFHYYTIELDPDSDYYGVSWWTIRYLIDYRLPPDPAFHKIEIIDLFNNKSM